MPPLPTFLRIDMLELFLDYLICSSTICAFKILLLKLFSILTCCKLGYDDNMAEESCPMPYYSLVYNYEELLLTKNLKEESFFL
jgi:hypothetical protein